MFKLIKYAFLAILALLFATLAFANRDMVTLELLPKGLTSYFGGADWTVTLPLFVVILGAIAIGLLIGFVMEWLREHKHRAAAAQGERQKKELAREVDRLKTEKNAERDEVLALLDDAPRKAS